MRPSGRTNNALRAVKIETNVNRYAEGSCLISFGNTKVLCTASIDEKVPGWMKGSGKGWVTAEYGMLPRSTHDRMSREAAKGKQSGRTVEIGRLIGRSLRAVVDMEALGERQILIDCDVIQADGGTRTAAITGGYVALHLAIQKLLNTSTINNNPLTEQVAAISCGVTKSGAVVDLDYEEDSSAIADANFVLSSSGSIIEVQATAEEHPISPTEFQEMFTLAQNGIQELLTLQNQAITGA